MIEKKCLNKKMGEYFFPVYEIPDIGERLKVLEQKLIIDLDLGPLYKGNIFDIESNNIVISFGEELSKFKQNTLNNVVQIIIYGAKVQADVYKVDYNNFNRRSNKTLSNPTNEHDCDLGYSVGSVVLTLEGFIYICVDNTAQKAVWRKLVFEI